MNDSVPLALLSLCPTEMDTWGVPKHRPHGQGDWDDEHKAQTGIVPQRLPSLFCKAGSPGPLPSPWEILLPFVREKNAEACPGPEA